jgi:hypothetical protein
MYRCIVFALFSSVAVEKVHFHQLKLLFDALPHIAAVSAVDVVVIPKIVYKSISILRR